MRCCLTGPDSAKELTASGACSIAHKVSKNPGLPNDVHLRSGAEGPDCGRSARSVRSRTPRPTIARHEIDAVCGQDAVAAGRSHTHNILAVIGVERRLVGMRKERGSRLKRQP